MLGYIYKIVRKDGTGDFYIGSSKNCHNRFLKHKSSCYNQNCNKYNYKVYQYIRSNGHIENFHYVILHTITFNDIKELLDLELSYIKELNPSLNYRLPIRDKKTYYIDKQEEIKNKNLMYYHNNKIIINEKRRLKRILSKNSN